MAPKSVKYRFIPKPPQKQRQAPPTDHDGDEQREAAQARLLEQVTANLRRGGRKVEKKSSSQVAFGYGGASSSSTSIRSSGVVRDMKPNDPISLPLREPNSGDPELQNEVEFGAAAKSQDYNKNDAGVKLGLQWQERSEDEKLYVFDLPPIMPFKTSSAGAKGKRKTENLMTESDFNKSCDFSVFPDGNIGTLQVTKKGKVRWKIRDILLNVNAGSECTFLEHAVAIDTTEQKYGVLGRLENTHVVVSPDVSSLLDFEKRREAERNVL